jgi:hypothetical protein
MKKEIVNWNALELVNAIYENKREFEFNICFSIEILHSLQKYQFQKQ